MDHSDILFPSDAGLPKLSSPMSFKVPDFHDWALDEFKHTLEKPCTDLGGLLSFKQYIPVLDEDDDYDDYDDFINSLPPKLPLPTLEEKEFLSQLSHHFLQLERIELRDILRGGFAMVQNDIQANNMQHYHNVIATPTSTSPPGLSWFNEAVDYGRHEIDNLDTIENPKRGNSFSPFEQIGRHGNNNNATTVASPSICSEQQEITTNVSRQVEDPLPASPPSAVQPTAPTPTTTTSTTTSHHHTKKGLKNKIKQMVKPFSKSSTSSAEKPKTSFIKNTKKFIQSIL
ncbi:hypothetical protein [Parasitella parasitica]|uniref:Uncharacterized protein n=1 Tax=Parasitella parasitica TaxID=35722 RepID=A0A0B7NEL1_9FUNG|nr:hypothetical protein [Parasitella parasitica]